MIDTATPTAATASSPPVELVIADVPATANNVGAVRHALSCWLDAAGIDPSRRPDIELAVYEALANTVEHAYRSAPAPGTFTVRAAYSGPAPVLTVAVSDHGQWQPPTPNPLRGNGLSLITAVTTGSTVTPSSEGTTVLMRWADAPV